MAVQQYGGVAIDLDETGRTEPGVVPGLVLRLNSVAHHQVHSSLVAVTVLVLLGMRQVLAQGLTIGYAAAFVTIPLWFPALKRYWGARPLVAVGVIALASGVWLTELASADHLTSSKNLISMTVMVLGMLCGVGVILWARLLMPMWVVGAAVGAGMLLATLPDAGHGNSWKFDYSVPVAVIVLALAGRSKSRLVSLGCLVALAVISATHDARSFFAVIAVTALLALWQALPASRKGTRSVAVTAVALVVTGFIAYSLATQLTLDGYLGRQAQARSISQIETSGSLLMGGRPEMAASVALFADRPWGFGSGVVPNLGDIRVAKTGMKAINYEPNNGYVENYMFGDELKLHSVIADTWAHFGIPGLAFAATVSFLIVRAVVTSIARRSAVALVLFLCVLTFWNLLFSPIYSSVPTLMLTLGLVLAVKPVLLGAVRGPMEQVLPPQRRQAGGP